MANPDATILRPSLALSCAPESIVHWQSSEGACRHPRNQIIWALRPHGPGIPLTSGMPSFEHDSLATGDHRTHAHGTREWPTLNSRDGSRDGITRDPRAFRDGNTSFVSPIKQLLLRRITHWESFALGIGRLSLLYQINP